MPAPNNAPSRVMQNESAKAFPWDRNERGTDWKNHFPGAKRPIDFLSVWTRE